MSCSLLRVFLVLLSVLHCHLRESFRSCGREKETKERVWLSEIKNNEWDRQERIHVYLILYIRVKFGNVFAVRKYNQILYVCNYKRSTLALARSGVIFVAVMCSNLDLSLLRAAILTIVYCVCSPPLFRSLRAYMCACVCVLSSNASELNETTWKSWSFAFLLFSTGLSPDVYVTYWRRGAIAVKICNSVQKTVRNCCTKKRKVI